MKPIINDVPAFDVRYGTTGTFTNKSSIHAYKITIKSISGVLLYDGDIISSSTKTFQIPADISTISNNNNYLLYLTTYEGAVTDFSNFYTSDAKIIKCFHTPDFELTIHGGSTIFYEQTSPVLFTGIEFRMWYGENEDLNEFYVVVYDSNNKVVFKSDTYYNKDDIVEIDDLENNKQYKVIGYGKTINGMNLQTTIITVSTNFTPTSSAFALKGENVYDKGYVKLSSDITATLYRFGNNGIEYLDPNGVKLTNNWLQYYHNKNNSENLFSGDFSMYLEFTPLERKSVVFIINTTGEVQTGEGNIKLVFKTKKDNDNYIPFFELHLKNTMVVINKNANGSAFSSDTLENILSHKYTIKLSKIGNDITIKII